MAGRLSHSDQIVLNESVATAVKRDLPGGGFAWQRTPKGSIAPLVAATLAHWSLLRFGGAAVPKMTPVPLMDQSPTDGDGAHFRDLDRIPF